MENEESPYVVGQDASSISEAPKVSFPSDSKKIKGGRWILVAIAAVLVIAGGAIFIIGTKKSGKVELTPSPSPEAMGEAVESTPAPTTEPVNKEKVDIQILNGTGIPKEASYLQEILQKLGYSTIDMGNAANQDGAKKVTEVVFSSDLSSEVKDEIKSKLEDIYQDVSVSSSSSSSIDVKITTGLRKGQTPKPEATSTPKPTGTPAASSSPTPTSTPTASPAT